MSDSFPNFAYVSSHLHLKYFAWKQDYVSKKPYMLKTSSKPI